MRFGTDPTIIQAKFTAIASSHRPLIAWLLHSYHRHQTVNCLICRIRIGTMDESTIERMNKCLLFWRLAGAGSVTVQKVVQGYFEMKRLGDYSPRVCLPGLATGETHPSDLTRTDWSVRCIDFYRLWYDWYRFSLHICHCKFYVRKLINYSEFQLLKLYFSYSA